MKHTSTMATRVKYIRSLSGLTAEEFCTKYGLSVNSFRKWEAGICPLSTTSAHKLAHAASLGLIMCSPVWILTGKGEEAKLISEYLKKKNTPELSTEDNNLLSLTKELEAFKKIHPNCETLIVDDDSMAPHFNIGDYVAGVPIDLNNLKKYLDRFCIVETANGKRQIRRLGYNSGEFLIFGLNYKFKEGAIFEANPKIVKLSPIFWHRIVQPDYES